MDQLLKIDLPKDFSQESLMAFYEELTQVVHPAALIAAACVVLYTFFCVLQSLLRDSKLPPIVSGWIPFVGAGIQFVKDPLALARRNITRHGECFTLSMFGQRLTFFVGPTAHKFFFCRKDEELSQREVYTFSVPIFGENIVYDCDEGTRLEQFRLLALALKGEKVKSYTPIILREAEDYFKQWTGEGKVCLRSAMSELIILTASRALMGDEVRENLFADVSRLYSQLDEGLKPISFFLPYLPIPAHKRRDAAREEMIQLFSKVIKKRREEGRHGDDMLQVFMDGQYKDGRKFTDQEVTGLLIALLFAGQHTSSVSSTWTGLLVLDQKEKYWPRLQEENKKILKKFDNKITFEALQEMEMLGACIREAIRMYPPLIFLMRKVKKDLTFQGENRQYKIPKGDIAFVSPAAGMRYPGSFTNPDTYDPERFMAPREEDKAKSYAWIGFGGGRHGCMGEIYAYLQIKIIWTVLLRDFDMTLDGALPKPNYEALVVGPANPCDVIYKRTNTQK